MTNKLFKTSQSLAVATVALASFTALVLTAAYSNAATITIGNHSFEDATNTSWQSSSNGSTPANPVTTSGVIASTIHDTPPDGTDRIHHSNGQSGHDIYQVLGTTVAANTIYTMTVDIGDRTDLGPGSPVLRLGTVSATPTATDDYGLNLLTGTIVANTIPLNGAGASDGWETWITTFTTGASPTGFGDALRVELENVGGAQALFDNVRLDASPIPEPSAAVLLGLGGLAFVLRRRRQ